MLVSSQKSQLVHRSLCEETFGVPPIIYNTLKGSGMTFLINEISVEEVSRLMQTIGGSALVPISRARKGCDVRRLQLASITQQSAYATLQRIFDT